MIIYSTDHDFNHHRSSSSPPLLSSKFHPHLQILTVNLMFIFIFIFSVSFISCSSTQQFLHLHSPLSLESLSWSPLPSWSSSARLWFCAHSCGIASPYNRLAMWLFVVNLGESQAFLATSSSLSKMFPGIGTRNHVKSRHFGLFQGKMPTCYFMLDLGKITLGSINTAQEPGCAFSSAQDHASWLMQVVEHVDTIIVQEAGSQANLNTYIIQMPFMIRSVTKLSRRYIRTYEEWRTERRNSSILPVIVAMK